MKQLQMFLGVFFVSTLPFTAMAQATAAKGQEGPAVRGYTDAQGKPLPRGDIQMSVASDGTKTTVTITGLQAYGEANLNPKDGAAKREASYSTDPDYFKGGTIYGLKHGDDYRGGRTAASAKLEEDKGIMVLGKAPVGDNKATFTFPSLKAAKDFECQTTSWLLSKGQKRAWIGHAGYVDTDKGNDEPRLGDYLFFAQGDKRFPGTGFCYDKVGKIVPLTTMHNGLSLRHWLGKRVQKPMGVDDAPKQKDD